MASRAAASGIGDLGEGGYEQSERLIQQLLSEAGGTPVAGDVVAVSGKGPQAAADERNLRSGETYVGHNQARNFAFSVGIKEDAPNLYRTPSALPLNRWSLAGVWTIGGEFATLNEPSGSITYRFHARDLHLVLAPHARGEPIRFRVKIDGAPPGADHGFDVDAQGWGSVADEPLYRLISANRVSRRPDLRDRVLRCRCLAPTRSRSDRAPGPLHQRVTAN